MPAAGMSHVAFCVRDMEKSLAFYREALGFRVLNDRANRPMANPSSWTRSASAMCPSACPMWLSSPSSCWPWGIEPPALPMPLRTRRAVSAPCFSSTPMAFWCSSTRAVEGKLACSPCGAAQGGNYLWRHTVSP
jgi:hypothetical protein